MKNRTKWLLVLLSVALLLAVALFLVPARGGTRVAGGGTHVADVAVIDRDTGETVYYQINANQTVRRIDAFTPDDAVVYTAAQDCFVSYISGNKVLNRLGNGTLFDGSGSVVENTATLDGILRQIAMLEHDLWDVRIIEDNGSYFVFVALNVNWSSPCDLYRCDGGSLTKLCRFDHVDFAGIRLP